MKCFVYILGSSGKDGYRTYVGFPDSGLYSGGFVGNDQNMLAVIALEVLALIGREADREIVSRCGSLSRWP
jgi:hypothetical protein